MTNTIPQIIIPELKLFAVTRRARGRENPMITSVGLSLLILVPSSAMKTATKRIRDIFTSSVGWN